MLPMHAAAVENESEYMSMEEAAAYVRSELAEFHSGFSVKFKLEDPQYYTDHGLIDLFLEEVYRHTGVPDEGDYMRWTHQNFGYEIDYIFDGKTHYASVKNITPRYNNTAQQEEILDQKVKEVLESLNLDGKSDYEKIKAIYTYICENVEYSEEVLFSNIDLCSPPDEMKVYWSAYGALVLGSATCQGFTSIVYRMMLEAGIDCRLIAGDVGAGVGHGWNIVELDGIYYYLEPTDDSGNLHGGDGLKHFLDGSASFRVDDGGSERFAYVESYTAEFTEQYPVSVLDYGQEELLTGDAGQVLGSGRCGNNARWTLTADGTLTISGSGSIWRADLFGFWNGGQIIPRWDNLNGYIKQVEIQEGITAIGSYAFANCPRLTQVAIPPSVSSIGSFAFGLCESMTQITLPDTVESLGEKVFYQCVGLEHVAISASLKEIPSRTFCGCTSLETVHIPNGVQIIGDASFAYCTSLQGIEIPTSVTAIEDMAFGNAFDPAAEVVVVIPETVEELGGGCFEASAVYRLELKMRLETLEPMMFNQCNGLQFVELSDTVRSIGAYAFAECANLKGIRLPSALQELGESAFQNCPGLQSVELPETLTSIPTSAFIRCKSLEEIVIPGSVERIGNGAFEDCRSLKKVTISDGVKKLDGFVFSGCIALEKLIFEGDAPSFGNAILAWVENLTIYYPGDNTTWTQEVLDRVILGGIAETVGLHGVEDPHTLEDGWRLDEESHWKKCTGCDYREQVEPHNINSAHTCEVCGYGQDNHELRMEYNQARHYMICQACGFVELDVGHNFNSDNICEDCGFDQETSHSFCTGMNHKYHWEKCEKCGEIVDKEPHVYNGGEVCEICGYMSMAMGNLLPKIIKWAIGSALGVGLLIVVVVFIKKKKAK